MEGAASAPGTKAVPERPTSEHQTSEHRLPPGDGTREPFAAEPEPVTMSSPLEGETSAP